MKRTRFLFALTLFLLCISQIKLYALVGDVDGDGTVDGFDAVLILRHDVGLITLSATQLTDGDTDGDGTVDGFDAVLVLRCDVGLISCTFDGGGGTSAVCGNGTQEIGEQCDDGNAVTESCSYGETSCTVCSNICQNVAGATSYCGDNTEDTANSEQCDDGGTTDGDGCSSTCQTETTSLDTPSNVQAAPCTYGTHTLLCMTWDAAQSLDVTGYNIWVYHDTETFSSPYNGARPIMTARYTVGGLTPGENYGVEVTSVVEVNGIIQSESSASDRALDSTVANAGNQAVVSFRSIAAVAHSSGRYAAMTTGVIESGYEALEGADAFLRDAGGALVAQSTTDEFGWAEFDSMGAGTFELNASHDMDTPADPTDDLTIRVTGISVVAGQALNLGDIILSVGEFSGTSLDIAQGPDGLMYLLKSSDKVNIYTTDGDYISQWGEPSEEAWPADGDLKYSQYFAIDADGYVYISEYNRLQKFTSDGQFVSVLLSENGCCGSIAIDADGFIYMTTLPWSYVYSDGENFLINKYTSDGQLVTQWGAQAYSTYSDGEVGNLTDITIDSDGYIYVTDVDLFCVHKFTSDGTFVTRWDFGMYAYPGSIAVDGNGYVYVDDASNYVVQKYTSNGTFVTQWGALGTGDGEFDSFGQIAIDSTNNVYVIDAYLNERVQKFTSDGTYITQWNTGKQGAVEFSMPYDIDFDSSGNIYVVDQRNSRVQKIASDGTLIETWGRFGSGDGLFNFPKGIAIDNSDNIYISDTNNDRIQKFDTEGTYITQWGLYGTGDGQFLKPGGIAVDSSGNVYVSDDDNARIQKFTSDGVYVTQWSTYGRIDVDGEGNIIVAAPSINGIQKFTSDGQPIETIESDEGTGTSGIAIDSGGNIYVSNCSGGLDNNYVTKYRSDGYMIKLWGDYGTYGEELFSCPGEIAIDASDNVYVLDKNDDNYQVFPKEWVDLVSFYEPADIAVDSSGAIYVTDQLFQKVVKFNAGGTLITAWGEFGSGDGELINPAGIAVDSQGYVYVVDQNNDRVQKFTSDGTYVTQWGSSGTGNGQFQSAQGIGVDSSDNIYVTDFGSNRIQKFTSGGTYVTQWGTTGSGNGQFSWPHNVAIDSDGYVYVSDTNNNRIQKFTSDGVFVGSCTDPAPDPDVFFSGPGGIAVDSENNVYVLNRGMNQVLKLSSECDLIALWGSLGTGAGEFDDPRGIAVDSAGNVIVLEYGNLRYQIFSKAWVDALGN